MNIEMNELMIKKTFDYYQLSEHNCKEPIFFKWIDEIIDSIKLHTELSNHVIRYMYNILDKQEWSYYDLSVIGKRWFKLKNRITDYQHDLDEWYENRQWENVEDNFYKNHLDHFQKYVNDFDIEDMKLLKVSPVMFAGVVVTGKVFDDERNQYMTWRLCDIPIHVINKFYVGAMPVHEAIDCCSYSPNHRKKVEYIFALIKQYQLGL